MIRALAALAVVATAAVATGPSDTPATADVTGTVTYSGPAAPGTPVDMSNDPYCVEAHAGRTVSMRTVLAGEDGGLANVIVYVKEAPSGGDQPVPAESAVLDQSGCIYSPHVVTVRAGQDVVIRNSDETLHNVHVRPEANRGFNVGQPLAGVEAHRVFDVPEVGIRVSCDIHGWMQGVIAVFDHPFFAVTDEDGGFELSGLPPGDYVVEAWHESLGIRSADVTVGPGPVTLSFDFGG